MIPEPESASRAEPGAAQAALPRLAMTTFVVLFAIHLLDYLDRNILTSLQPQIRADIPGLTNERWGLLATIFLVTYSIFSPVTGWLADRYRRTWLLAAGIGIWSLATIGSGLAHDYGHLALARSFLGIGEATYGVVAPTILIDLFRRDQRSRLMSAFYLAMPLGAAMGIMLGPKIANQYSGYELRLMPSVADASGLPAEGKTLIVVGSIHDSLAFRVFDGEGRKIADTDESKLANQTPPIDDFRRQQIVDFKKEVAGLWPPHPLTNGETSRVIIGATSIVGLSRFSWHKAFFIVGLPGLLAAFVVFFLPEPVRGATEDIDPARLKEHEQAGATREDYVDLMVNSSYTYAVFGMSAYTFAIGGMLIWIPPYLYNTRAFEQEQASDYLAYVTFAAAVVGMMTGGWLADRLAKKSPGALFLVPGFAMLASIPFVLMALLSSKAAVIYPCIFAAEALMFVNTGPCMAIIANVVQPNLRGAAMAISYAAVHFLGDIWSPWLIGKAADMFGDPETMNTSIGRALKAIGAVPTRVAGHPPENLVAGLLILIPALLLAGVVLLAGARHLPREMALMRAKLKAAPTKGAA